MGLLGKVVPSDPNFKDLEHATRFLEKLPFIMARQYNDSVSIMIQRVFPILAISVFSSMLGVGIIAPLLPVYAEGFGASLLWIGIIFGAYSLTRAIFTPIIGRLSDRSGRKVFICTGLLAYALISLIYIVVDSMSSLIIVRLLHGATAAMILPIAQAYIGELSPEGKESTWMGYFNVAFMTGFGIGPFLGAVLSEHVSMDSAFYAMGAFNLLAFILAIAFLPEIRGKAGERTAVPFIQIMQSPSLRGVFSFRLTNAMGRSVLFAFLPILAGPDSDIGLSMTLVGIILTVNVLTISFLQVPFGRLGDRVNRRTLVAVGSLIDVVILCMIPLAGSFVEVFGLILAGSIGRAFSLPSASAMVVNEGKKYSMGSAMGSYNMAMSLGIAVGPVLAGATGNLSIEDSVFYFGAAMGLLGIGMFMHYTREQDQCTKIP